MYILLAATYIGKAIGFVINNWKAILAALVLLAAAVFYQRAEMAGYKKRVDEDAKAQVVLLQKRLLTLSLIAEQDKQRAAEDTAKITELETLANATPKNDGGCLSPDAARRVRAIGGPKPVAAPLPASRHSNVLPGRLKRP
jgi:hypothetical protein